jgi:hypothetical protein
MDVSTAIVIAWQIRQQKKALENAQPNKDYHKSTDILLQLDFASLSFLW